MDRCALFVDAGYMLADGSMAVHGTRDQEAVSWDYAGLLQLLSSLASEGTGLPLLRCYWYDAAIDGRRTRDHDALADLPGLKLRLGRMRPGRRDGVDAEVHRDLSTLAHNQAIADAIIVSAEEDLAHVIADVQDLGLRVTLVHVAVEGNSPVSRVLRQECDTVIEVDSAHLRPYVRLAAGAGSLKRPAMRHAADALSNGHGAASGHGPSGHGGAASGHGGHLAAHAGQHLAGPAIYGPRAGARDQAHEPELPNQAAEPASPSAAAPTGNPAPPHAGDAPSPGAVSAPAAARAEATVTPPVSEPAPASPASEPAAVDEPPHLGGQLAAAGSPVPGTPLTGSAPAGTVPTRAVPAGSAPAGSAPAGTVPTRAVPTGAVPAGSASAGSAPAGGAPPGAAERAAVSQREAASEHAPVGQHARLSRPVPVPGSQPASASEPAAAARQPDEAPQPAQLPQRAVASHPADMPKLQDQPVQAQLYAAPTPSPVLSAPPAIGPVAPYLRSRAPLSEPRPAAVHAGPAAPVAPAAAATLAEATAAAHAEGLDFGDSVARDAPALWLEAVLARKPRMPSDLEARLLQGSSLPIDCLLHDEVRQALRRGFWDALERARR